MKRFQHTFTWFDENRKQLFWLLTCLVLLFASCYVYFVNTAALNGVRCGVAEQEITTLGGEVSELESTYLSLKQSVTLSLAYERGFEDIGAVKFISTEKVSAVAKTNEI